MFRLFHKRCFLCKRKTKTYYHYVDHNGNSMKVCPECAVYAERRAFRKKV
jgi:hypothetical protein